MTHGYLSTALVQPLIEQCSDHELNSLSEQSDGIRRLMKHIKDPNACVRLDDTDELLHKLIKIKNDDSFCIQPLKKFNPQSSCQLQHLFLCCNTLREALYYLEKFSTLLCDSLDVQVTKARDNTIKVKIPTDHTSVNPTLRRRIEVIISTLTGWFKQLCGSDFTLKKITVPFPETDYSHAYYQAWGGDVEFSQNECSIQMHPKWLDRGLHNTNPHILTMMRRVVEDQYRKVSRSGSLADRIRKALAQQKIRLNANQQEVAEYFHISARTLNRHLHKEETSLKQIVTYVRLDMAKSMLLSSDENIEQIAIKLGLSGRRTLDRIFIKELNASPAQYRQSHKHNRPAETSDYSLSIPSIA